MGDHMANVVLLFMAYLCLCLLYLYYDVYLFDGSDIIFAYIQSCRVSTF